MKRQMRRNDDTATRQFDGETMRQSATRAVVPVGGTVGDYLVKITYPDGTYHNILCHDVDECYEVVSWADKDVGVPERTIVNMMKAANTESGYVPLRRWGKYRGRLVGSKYRSR